MKKSMKYMIVMMLLLLFFLTDVYRSQRKLGSQNYEPFPAWIGTRVLKKSKNSSRAERHVPMRMYRTQRIMWWMKFLYGTMLSL